MRTWTTATATMTATTALLVALTAAPACKRGGDALAKRPPVAAPVSPGHAHGSLAAARELEPASDATVTIDVTNAPPGLVVEIDGAAARIPATVARTPGHTHRVRATAPGHAPLAQEIPERGPDYLLLELREAAAPAVKAPPAPAR